MLYRHQSYVLQQFVAPFGVAGQLVAGVAFGVGGEDGFAGRGEAHPAALRHLVDGLVALNGVDDGQGVPHLLELVLDEELVDPLDGVHVGPAQVFDDLLGGIVERVAHLAGREAEVDVLGQQFEEFQRVVDGGCEVVVVFKRVAEHAAHEVDLLHFSLHQFHAAKGRELVGAGLQQAREAGDEADGDDGHRLVGLRGKQLAVELVAVHVFAVVAHGALEEGLALDVAGVGHVVVGDEHARRLHAELFQADGDVGVAVVVVHHVDGVGVGAVHAVDDHAEQRAALHVHVAVEHHQGEEVIGRAAHVAVVDDADVLLLVVRLHTDAELVGIHDHLLVFAGEGEGCGEAVFGEGAVAVEVVEARFGVAPAAHVALMGAGMLEHLLDALAAEAVLRLLVGNHQAFGGLAHGVEVEGEAVGVYLPHDVEHVGHFLVGKANVVLALVLAYHRKGHDHCQYNKDVPFHITS